MFERVIDRGKLKLKDALAHRGPHARPKVAIVPLHVGQVVNLIPVNLPKLSDLIKLEIFHASQGVDLFSHLLLDKLGLVGMVQDEDARDDTTSVERAN